MVSVTGYLYISDLFFVTLRQCFSIIVHPGLQLYFAIDNEVFPEQIITPVSPGLLLAADCVGVGLSTAVMPGGLSFPEYGDHSQMYSSAIV